MIGAISSYASRFDFASYAAARSYSAGYIMKAQKAAEPQTPVEPVRAVVKTTPETQTTPKIVGPLIREGADPVEMAVRMRIQYVDDPAAEVVKSVGIENKDVQTQLLGDGDEVSQAHLIGDEDEASRVYLLGDEDEASRVHLIGDEDEASQVHLLGDEDEASQAHLIGDEDKTAETQQESEETEEEQECQTCENRKYQDGSNDPGVSFKTPGHIDPESSTAVVRGHEMEHVVNNRAKAARENREVVSQSVTLHTAICPECGTVYTSGGTTRTVLSGEKQQEQTAQQPEQIARVPFSAVA